MKHIPHTRTEEDDGRLGGRHRGECATALGVPVQLGDDDGAHVHRVVEGLGLQ